MSGSPFVRSWRANLDLPPWWWTCARYPSAHMARAAFERVERKTKSGGELGLYRHGPRDDAGTRITALGLDRGAVERAARLLRDGVDEPLSRDLVEAMVARRARVVVEAARAHAEPGRILIRRPESGAVLDERGYMHDEPRGQG